MPHFSKTDISKRRYSQHVFGYSHVLSFKETPMLSKRIGQVYPWTVMARCWYFDQIQTPDHSHARDFQGVAMNADNIWYPPLI